MKIVIIDFAASEGGALSILKEYYDKAKKDNKNNYIFILSDNYLAETDNIKIKILKKEKNWIGRLIFDYITGKKIIEEIKPDLVLSLQNTIVRGIKVKQHLYVHQAIPFQKIKKFSFFKKKEFKLAIIQYLIGACIKSSIKNADRVIVQTSWMKEAIIDDCNISSKKIEIIPPSIDLSYVKKQKKNKKNLFFYPTSDHIYKNNEIIYSAVEKLNKEGISNFEIELTIDGESSECIKKIGRISRKEVFDKYSESTLIFPSYIETYGLPLLEAKKSGATIITSDTPFSHEILDKYNKVIYFNPFDSEMLKSAIMEVLDEKKNKSEGNNYE